jgi:RNA polymerase sigma-70 factor (ECF subfamily)
MAEDCPVTDIARLVTEHHRAVYGYAFRLAGSVADAEDLTQQTFLLAQQRLGQLRQPESARSWLFAILRNCFFKTCQRLEPVPATDLDLNLDAMPAAADGAEAIDSERLQQALNELSAEGRVVLAMYYYEECSYREMAEKLDVPIGTVMSRLARAKVQLRTKLFEPEIPARRRQGST